MKKIMIMMMLIMIPAVMGGVSHPYPNHMVLGAGESGEFSFQIQTVASNEAVSCTYENIGDNIIRFDDGGSSVIEGGTVYFVHGRVVGIESGQVNICVSCKSLHGAAGYDVEVKVCDLPIDVEIELKENSGVVPVIPLFGLMGGAALMYIGRMNIRRKRAKA